MSLAPTTRPPTKRANRLQATEAEQPDGHGVLGGALHARPSEGKVVWYNGVRDQPDLPGRRHRVVPRRGDVGAPRGTQRRGPAQQAGEESGYDQRAVLLRAHAPRLRRADPAPTPEGRPRRSGSDQGLAGAMPARTSSSAPTPAAAPASSGTTISIASSARTCRSSRSPCRASGATSRRRSYMQRARSGRRSTDFVVEAVARAASRSSRAQTGQALRLGRPVARVMRYIKRASELRLEAMELCKVKPVPGQRIRNGSTASPRSISCPADPRPGGLLRGQEGRDRAARRRRASARCRTSSYRLSLDGIMNWNKIGWLADKFAELRRLRHCRPLHAHAASGTSRR